MAVLVNRQYLLMLFLASMYQHSVAQCQTNLTNIVVREGHALKFSQPEDGNCTWKAIPGNEFFNMVQMVASSEHGIAPAYNRSMLADESGLTIVNASTSLAENEKHSIAGLYMMEDSDGKCNAAAKVAVIKSGPTCECNASTKTSPANYSCSIVYADSPVSAMAVQVTLTSANGKDQVKDTPVPKKKDRLVYIAETTVSVSPSKGKGKGKIFFTDWAPDTCGVLFMAPKRGPFTSMAKNTPDFTGSCTFKCV